MRRYQTMDGNGAAAYIAYALAELAAIYPITPSSPMAELVDEWSVQEKENIFEMPVEVDELQSEAGAAAAVHGALKTGVLATTFTSSQGLLLMLPNMYEIAGKLLPAVFHVASRTLSTSALSIFGDHSDVMAARQTGFAMLAQGSVQEVMDLSAVAHYAALEGQIPFINFFDGFRTSHELQKIAVLEKDELKALFPVEAYQKFKARKMNPNNPHISGTAQNSDIHFQQRELINNYYAKIPAITQKYMDEINKLRGTDYQIVEYYGDDEATEVIVAMGSVSQTIRQVVDYLNRKTTRKVGFINIRLYRPFPSEEVLKKLPATAMKVAVLDRCKEPGAEGEPLLQDVRSALYNHVNRPFVIGGRYGLASKDVTPEQIVAVYDELAKDLNEIKQEFTVGITDDVTNYSLEVGPRLDLTKADTFQAMFYGYGSDGTVGGTKQAIKILGDGSNHYVQGYFVYDSKKSGGLTISYLRASDEPINSPYLIYDSDYIGCHNAAYLHQYDMLAKLKPGGIFVLNTQWDKEQVLYHLPKKVKREIARKKVEFYVIDAYGLAAKVGLNRRINTIMTQVFFELTSHLPKEHAKEKLLISIEQTYAKKSKEIILKNQQAVELASEYLQKVDYPQEEWSALEIKTKAQKTDSYMDNIAKPMLAFEGDKLKVSDLQKYNMDDGRMPLGTSSKESSIPALEVPRWDINKCTQCNECSFICPHAAIRPIVLDEAEKEAAPEGFITQDFKGADGLYYRIQVAVDKCTGCSLCVDACPTGALSMQAYEDEKDQAINWAFAMTAKQKQFNFAKTTVQSSQLNQPLLEFSGACSGCGETPYVKLLTQLYGERLMIANATGCSSIWGASAPTTPYTTNEQGCGPAWSNSLLEDAAEYGYGMYKANQLHRNKLARHVQEILSEGICSEELQNLLQDWLEHKDESEGTTQRATKVIQALENEASTNETLNILLADKDLFVKPSQWIIGGDGWAYDIGYGGLDHILASGANVNLLVLDNEVYANTGGQTSKATPEAAIAKFSANGKKGMKKDLGQMAMIYKDVYVAQVSANANPMQTIKAFEEAEKYDGPSLIIAYTPCIAHGLFAGMQDASKEAKEAVESGYWSLYRYNPQAKKPMTLDYKRPKFAEIKDFLIMQNRFSSLKKVDKATAEELFEKITNDAKERFFAYARIAGQEDKLRAKYDVSSEDDSKMTTSERSKEELEQARLERKKRREERKKARKKEDK